MNFFTPHPSHEQMEQGGVMPGTIDMQTVLAIAIPLGAIHLGLAVFCLFKIIREGTANLNRWIWGLIVFLVNFFGSFAFILFGRRRDR
jgi:uncharacterized membrane protein